MHRRTVLIIAILLCATVPSVAQHDNFVGVWRAKTYEINGTAHPMQGLFIFSKNYYSANVRFTLSGGPIDDANGNAGPYSFDGKHIVFTQWVQIHVRPEDQTRPILSREGPNEASDYRFEGDRLILTFPSKNRYVLERLAK
jgi:hypothetical protein